MPVSVVLITGNELRHRFFAHQCSAGFNLKHVFFEQKANVHEQFNIDANDKEIVSAHFKLRTASEQSYFSSYENVDGLPHSFISNGESNSAFVFDMIKKINPAYIILFGSSLIRDPLLSAFQNRVVNIHLGLSPYYRGSGTNFWPLVHGKPECIGATIHLATSIVDAGAILQQLRPQVSSNDSVHDMGNKTIIAAAEILPLVVDLYENNEIQPVLQTTADGFVCKRKDLTAPDIELLYKNFDGGMIKEYLYDQEKRNEPFPIIDQLHVKK